MHPWEMKAKNGKISTLCLIQLISLRKLNDSGLSRLILKTFRNFKFRMSSSTISHELHEDLDTNITNSSKSRSSSHSLNFVISFI